MPAFACDGDAWRQIAQEAKSRILTKKLSKLVAAHEYWRWYFSFSPLKDTKMIQAKWQKLNAKEKEELRQYFDENPPEAGTLPELLALKVYSGKTWQKYLERINDKGVEGYPFLVELKETIENMPEDLRESVLNGVKKEYPTARKNKTIDFGMEPKRALDCLVSVIFPPEKHIREAMEKGSSTKEALDSYFKLIQPYLGTEKRLDVDDILIASHAVQKVLRKYGNEIPEKERTHPLSVMLFGSVVNGRGTENSDVDTAWSDEALYKYKLPALDKSLFSLMDEEVNKAIQKRHPEFKNWKADMNGPLTFLHSEQAGVPVFSLSSPILVRVTPEKIELVIADRNKITRAFGKDKSVDITTAKSYLLH